jgi:CRP-like cAMP-binding protein
VAYAILAGLPAPELQALAERLEVIDVTVGQPVYAPGGPIKGVYFPLDSVFSLVAVADDRVVIEVATVGREAMVGLPLFLGTKTSPQPAFCQIAGNAARLEAEQFGATFAAHGALHQALSRLTHATMVQIKT